MNLRRNLPLLAAVVLLGLAVNARAVPGPEHKTLRPLGMGNAFVAVADDKDALYYNPAGLSLINALGNRARRPNQANYPRNRLDARLNVLGVAAPGWDTYQPFWDFFNQHKKSFGSIEDIEADSTMSNDLAPINGRAVPMTLMNGAEFAMNNYGGALWVDNRITPVVYRNPLFPTLEIEDITVDAVVQLGVAHSFLRERLSVGAGYRLVNRQQLRELKIDSKQVGSDSGQEQLKKDLIDSLTGKFDNLTDPSTYGHGLDFGVLWQQNSWLRFGAAIQNVGMYLNHQAVTPKLTVGTSVAVPLASTGGVFARKVNVALDMEDLLNDERNYKPLSKLNFGAEVEQYGWHFFSVRASGGFKGGYWTAGAGLSLLDLVHVNAVSWAEEKGYFTGQVEDRLYALEVSVGL